MTAAVIMLFLIALFSYVGMNQIAKNEHQLKASRR